MCLFDDHVHEGSLWKEEKAGECLTINKEANLSPGPITTPVLHEWVLYLSMMKMATQCHIADKIGVVHQVRQISWDNKCKKVESRCSWLPSYTDKTAVPLACSHIYIYSLTLCCRACREDPAQLLRTSFSSVGPQWAQ